ncbi:DUF2892 domain-containing protein [Pedobacter sp. P351]|uniref:YgaP family membrane protein n=1 Tax=Pedobacter superstes TaxID=3133441 RepID=UPI00309AB3E3
MENSIINRLSDTLNSSILQENENANVGTSERIISVGAGAFIALKGISNIFSHPLLALTELGSGGLLLYRGLTGYCPVKDKFEKMEHHNIPLSSPTVPVTTMPIESY